MTNSLAALNPDLAAQWHPTRNNDLTPDRPAVEFDGDIDVSVVTQFISGPEDKPYGLLFRSGRESGHGFGITETRVSGISEWEVRLGVKYPQTITDTSSTQIKRGKENTLRIVTNGSDVTAYINGKIAASMSDSTYEDGWVGLYVPRGQTVAFDNLLVTAFQ